MLKYKCHKEVHAFPMDRFSYNILRGWQLPADEDGADEGYIVIYGYNTDKHYVSWSPKSVFDEGYDV